MGDEPLIPGIVKHFMEKYEMTYYQAIAYILMEGDVPRIGKGQEFQIKNFRMTKDTLRVALKKKQNTFADEPDPHIDKKAIKKVWNSPSLEQMIEDYIMRHTDRDFMTPKFICQEIGLPNDKRRISAYFTQHPDYERQSNTTYVRRG